MPYNGAYIPGKPDVYKLSRSKIEFFLNCPRCFYLDRRLQIGQPPGFPFNLNSAVDHLLKVEFDTYRERQEPHPYMEKLGLHAVPFRHEKMEEWRFNFKGVSYLHPDLNLHLFGAVDDIWQDLDTGELIVVDYKSTSKNGGITLDAEWQIGYKRQMEIYQYLLRKNGFAVTDTGYFVYCNGIKDKPAFEEKLDFEISLIPYTGDDSWVEGVLVELYALLNQNNVPDYSTTCEYCSYQQKLSTVQ